MRLERTKRGRDPLFAPGSARTTKGDQMPLAYGPTADFPIARPMAQSLRRPEPVRHMPPRNASGSAIGQTVYTLSSLPRWDSSVDRYRRRDGRFW